MLAYLEQWTTAGRKGGAVAGAGHLVAGGAGAALAGPGRGVQR